MKLCALILLASSVFGGTFVCDATCLSKLASVSSIALNADKAVSGVKGAGAAVSHPFHPVAAWKRARGKKTK